VEFNFAFQHKYDYIKDDNMELIVVVRACVTVT